MSFSLDPRLEADSVPVVALELCDLRLMNDCRYPWLLLVPRRPGVVELHELDAAERGLLMEEIAAAAATLVAIAPESKINLGALGNVVPQLHVHVVARRKSDPAWPGPVWGQGAAVPYRDDERASLVEAVRSRLGRAI